MEIKPMLFVEDDLSEGVYAASGSSESTDNKMAVSFVSSEWGNQKFHVTLPSGLSNTFVVTVVFDEDLTDLWCSGHATFSGKTGTIQFWNKLDSFDFWAKSNKDPLGVVSYKVENA